MLQVLLVLIKFLIILVKIETSLVPPQFFVELKLEQESKNID